MKIYISGPITDSPNYKNIFATAYETLKELYGSDVSIINPTMLPEPSTLTWINFMKIDIHELLTCDTIYMLQGWEKSKGALLEHHIAEALEMHIIFESQSDERQYNFSFPEM